MFSKILIAYDGSEGARIAFNKALKIASQCGAQLSIIAVGRLPEYAETISEIDEAKAQAHRFYDKMLREAVNIVKDNGIEAEALLRYGKPGDVIPHVAEEIGADLIVLGTRRHSPFARRLLGATADKVVDQATCSVLIVR